VAERFIALDAAYGSVLVTCRCGFRTMRSTVAAAREAADTHRAESHPRQATYVESKRRSRRRSRATLE
jgi:hypothetical protein